MLAFLDSNSFLAGNLHRHLDVWKRIAKAVPCDLSARALPWITNRVNVRDFFKPFMGDYFTVPRSFTVNHVPGTLGVNLFAQSPFAHPVVFSNLYVFPAFCLFPHVCRFLQEQGITFTICVPDKRPRPSWWPCIQAKAAGSLLLGLNGSRGVVLPPSSQGFFKNWPLPWDLWVFRVSPCLG